MPMTVAPVELPSGDKVGPVPFDVAITPDGSKVDVTDFGDNAVSVIKTSSDSLLTTFAVGRHPGDIALTGDGAKGYVANTGSNSVSVVDTSLNSAATSVRVGRNPAEVVLH